MDPVPARLHAILARDAPVGVVFRRGPSRAVAVCHWDLRTDRITLGQWLRGRIYALRADLSPDGRHMISFAATYKLSPDRWGRPDTGGSWTAISRAGWLKALVLWGKGDGWNGGGLFLNRRRYWLNDGPFRHRLLESHSHFKRVPTYAGRPWHGGECPGVYFLRLARDGWETLETTTYRCAFRRDLPKGWRLHKLFHAQLGPPQGKGVYWEEHLLESADGQVIAGPDWEWADRHGPDLLYAARGCLWRQRIQSAARLGEPRLVHDFNPMVFERRTAPY